MQMMKIITLICVTIMFSYGKGTYLNHSEGTWEINSTSLHYIEDLKNIRLKIGAEKITMLGHSWGGALAVFYAAAAHPDRVKKLIVYDGGPMWPELRAAKKAAPRAFLSDNPLPLEHYPGDADALTWSEERNP